MEQGQEVLRFSLEPGITLSEQSPMGHCNRGLWLETTEGNGDPGALKGSAGPLKEFYRPFSLLHSFAQSQSCLNTTAAAPSHCFKPNIRK